MKAYVLLTVRVGTSPAIQDAIRSWGPEAGIIDCDAVAGTHDVVAVVDAADPKAIGDIVMTRIQSLDGVLSTSTLLAIG
ncbi:MAG: Lrp/AsnC ligand binding domain-containing protein [Thermomicrobiales bacterium]|jgi:DNA-binding Lrp family transcriptional regulator|nr:Lrp/AsnC ligand binding domain-containing protein [Thermomicrobiales bacterium]